ncbi:hypothetical protein KO489_15550 [Reinekea forsetii]|nr:hypothetical protein [Reinekea forsetii]
MTEQVKKLQEILDENMISAIEFAHCLGISEAHAAAYCDGSKKLSATLQRQIEQTFSKPSNWLNTGADAEGPNFDLFG